MSILNEIVKNKQLELDRPNRTIDITGHCTGVAPEDRRSFVGALGGDKVGVIAEIKKKSPSVGDLEKGQDLIAKAQEYEGAGVDAISVVTDKKYFGGSFELFTKIRNATKIPMLMKDFIIHPHQVLQAEQAGADALLIIGALHHHFHADLLSTLAQTNITPVVEVAHENELELPFVKSSRVIGVNARDLNTFDVSVDRACSIIKKISKPSQTRSQDPIVIGFSGISSRSDIERYHRAGAQAVLVGEMLMKTGDIKETITSLRLNNS